MEINKNIRSGKIDVDSYIESLENWIMTFKASNIFKLVESCDNVMGIISDDVQVLANVEDEEDMDEKLKILGSKKTKSYQKFREVIGDIKHFKAISDILEDIRPKVSLEQNNSIEGVKTNLKPKQNIQDFVLKNG